MAVLSNSQSYQRYLDRIQKYRQITDINAAFSEIQARVEQITHELTNSEDKRMYKYLQMALCIAAVVFGLLSAISGHLIWGSILIVGGILAWGYYKKGLQVQVAKLQSKHACPSERLQEQLIHQTQYVIAGVETKIKRIQLIRLSYVLLFPIFMFASVQFITTNSPLQQLCLLIIAYGIGSLFWFFYFKDAVDDLTYIHEELQTYEDELLLKGHTSIMGEKVNEEEE